LRRLRFCSGYGCPNNSKARSGDALREALLSGSCQVRYNCTVTRLLTNGGTSISGVEYIDADGLP
jgi:hypothetical protein